MAPTTRFPEGTFAPAPKRAPMGRVLASQTKLESTLIWRHGEQMLLTMIIPLAMLVAIIGLVAFAPQVELQMGHGWAEAVKAGGGTATLSASLTDPSLLAGKVTLGAKASIWSQSRSIAATMASALASGASGTGE